MAHGEQSAKERMYAEAIKMAEMLENGTGTDPSMMSRALAYVIRMLEGAVTTDFITVNEMDTVIESKFQEHKFTCPALQEHSKRQESAKRTMLHIGPVTWQGAVSRVTIVAMCIAYLIGKGKGWW